MPKQNAPKPADTHGRKPDEAMPAAGPHAKDHLTNKDATPGAGTLNDEKRGGNVDPGAG